MILMMPAFESLMICGACSLQRAIHIGMALRPGAGAWPKVNRKVFNRKDIQKANRVYVGRIEDSREHVCDLLLLLLDALCA